MTTKFSTMLEAMERNCFYAGVKPRESEVFFVQFTTVCEAFVNPVPAMQFKVRNKNGIWAHFAITEFRDGYDLWLLAEGNLGKLARRV